MSDFKMANTPEVASDSLIEKLYDEGMKPAEVLAHAFDRLESVMHRRPENARAFDLCFDYASYRPEGERWICVCLNHYDGAPDAEPPATFVGRGASEKEARMDLLEQFAEFDGRPMPLEKPSRVIHSSPFEPPEYADPEVTFDDDLEDRHE